MIEAMKNKKSRSATFVISVFFVVGSCLFVDDSSAQTVNSNPSGSFNNSNGYNGFNNTNQNQNNPQSSIGSRFGGSSLRSSGRDTSSSRRSRRSSRNSVNENLDPTQNPANSRQSLRKTRPSKPKNVPSLKGSSGSKSALSVYSKSGKNKMVKGKNKVSKSPKPRIKKVSIFYLNASSLSPKVNEAFTLEVKLSSREEITFDSLAFTLQYNPEDFMPVQGINGENQWIPANAADYLPEDNQYESAQTSTPGLGDKLSANFLWSENKILSNATLNNEIDTGKGTILFSAGLAEMKHAGTSTIARITFVPLREVRKSDVRFLFQNENHSDSDSIPLTHLRYENEDILGSKTNPVDGVIPFSVSVRKQNETESNRINSSIVSFNNRQSISDQPLTRIELKTSKNKVNTGDHFDLQVFLSNPKQQPVDSIQLLIVYNTSVLKALDSHVSSSRLQTDFTGIVAENEINSQKGIIHYRLNLAGKKSSASGQIATIRFQAMQPTTKTTFRILVSKHSSPLSTGVFYKEQDVLGDPKDPFDGYKTTSIAVQPTLAYLDRNQRNAVSTRIH